MSTTEQLDRKTHSGDLDDSGEFAVGVRELISKSRVYDAVLHQWPSESGEVEKLDKNDNWVAIEKRKKAEEQLHEFAQSHEEAFRDMCELGVDCLHGTTTLNLSEILKHGLVPSYLFKSIGITALGKENFSQPSKREGVHVVPVGNVNETVRYAEVRLKEDGQDQYVNPKNYKNFLPYLETDTTDMYDGFASYFSGHGQEAQRISDAIESGELTEESGSPVVLGIDSSKMRPETEFIFCNSAIEGDTKIGQIITVDFIPVIYTDQKDIEQVEAMLVEYGYTNTVVRDIGSIR